MGAPALHVEPGPTVRRRASACPRHWGYSRRPGRADRRPLVRWPGPTRRPQEPTRSQAAFVAAPAGARRSADGRTGPPEPTKAPMRAVCSGRCAGSRAWTAPRRTPSTRRRSFCDCVRLQDTVAEARGHHQPSRPAVRVVPAHGLPGAVFASLPGDRQAPSPDPSSEDPSGTLITQSAAPFASHGLAVLALPVSYPLHRDRRREVPELPAAWVELPIEDLQPAAPRAGRPA